MHFSASAPCKAILFGEHYVVYGAQALSCAIEPRNKVEFSDGAGATGIAMESPYGSGRIAADGSFSGPSELSIYSEVAKKVFGASAISSCSIKFVSAWKLKGVGTSASLCAAFAAGLFRLAGKKPSVEQIFSAAQAGDLIAHGGRASGIDAKTVSVGGAIIFQRKFSPPSFDFNPVKLSLPVGTSLILIDTFAGKKSSTAEMVALFAKSFGIAKPPQDLSEEERAGVREEYAQVWEKTVRVLAGSSAKEFGSLMNENHAILKKRGVSSSGIELAVSAALSGGAYGAKLTAAGGEGGAVLALCEKKNEKGIMKAVADAAGFASYLVSLAEKGACTD